MSPETFNLSRKFLPRQKFAIALLLLVPGIGYISYAEVKVPSIISDHIGAPRKVGQPDLGVGIRQATQEYAPT
jgi:hypothetical protein